jgi:pimeloyl-ACP methyl ester carboxylesterase
MWVACLALVILAACGPMNRPEAPRVAARDVSFQSAGHRLEGTVTSPERGSASAGVLIIGGSGPIDRDGISRVASAPPVYRWWAEGLSTAGFAVLRYDKRFVTHPNIEIAAFDQEAQIADALAALAFLRSAPEVTGRAVFVIGHSEGGTLAPIVASRAGQSAGVVVINTVVFPVDELLIAQLESNPTVPKAAVADVRTQLDRIKAGSFPRTGLLLGAGASYWKQWIDYSAGATTRLAELSAPLLVVQCLSDQTLPGATLDRNLENLRMIVARNGSAQLRELPANDHFAMRPGGHEASPEFMASLIRWLRQALSSR